MRYFLLSFEFLIGFMVYGVSSHVDNHFIWPEHIDSIVIQCVNPSIVKFKFQKVRYEIEDDMVGLREERVMTKGVMDSVIFPIESIYLKKTEPIEIQYDFIDDEIITESMFLDVTIYQHKSIVRKLTSVDYYYGKWRIIYSNDFLRLIKFIRKTIENLRYNGYNKFDVVSMLTDRTNMTDNSNTGNFITRPKLLRVM